MPKIRKNVLLLVPVALFLLVQNGDAAFRFRSASGRGENYEQQYRNNYHKALSMKEGAAHSPDTENSQGINEPGSKGGKGLSAWGIIAIIVGVIILGTGGYWLFVFYPYLCKKERSYDMIELTNVL